MSMESEQIFAAGKFESVVLNGFFADSPPELAALGRAVCRFLWDLDGRCHTQDWEGVADRVAMFSLPVHLRRWRTSKNYAAVYRPMAGDTELLLEVILPSRVDIREEILSRFAGKLAAETHALGQPRFRLAPGDFPGVYAELIREARAAKAVPLTDFLEAPAGVEDDA
jgi:hypothetical protein